MIYPSGRNITKEKMIYNLKNNHCILLSILL